MVFAVIVGNVQNEFALPSFMSHHYCPCRCEPATYPLLPSAVKFEVEVGYNEHRQVPELQLPADVYDKQIGLVLVEYSEEYNVS